MIIRLLIQCNELYYRLDIGMTNTKIMSFTAKGLFDEIKSNHTVFHFKSAIFEGIAFRINQVLMFWKKLIGL